MNAVPNIIYLQHSITFREGLSAFGDSMKFRCTICGHIYDEDKEKTPFDQLPDSWKCPLCGALKKDFVPVGADKKKEIVIVEDFGEMENLTVAQLAALCSNLAKGCEKQYRFEDRDRFMELSEYFSAVSPPSDDEGVEDILRMLRDDIDVNYPNVEAKASAESDRGALRIKVWGEKVTRMLDSLVFRYIEEGEEMLADTQIWVCTMCGFVYVGDAPPSVCPVCKVPSWKFQKMEARA